jgi:hypothetical protein
MTVIHGMSEEITALKTRHASFQEEYSSCAFDAHAAAPPCAQDLQMRCVHHCCIRCVVTQRASAVQGPGSCARLSNLRPICAGRCRVFVCVGCVDVADKARNDSLSVRVGSYHQRKTQHLHCRCAMATLGRAACTLACLQLYRFAHGVFAAPPPNTLGCVPLSLPLPRCTPWLPSQGRNSRVAGRELSAVPQAGARARGGVAAAGCCRPPHLRPGGRLRAVCVRRVWFPRVTITTTQCVLSVRGSEMHWVSWRLPYASIPPTADKHAGDDAAACCAWK